MINFEKNNYNLLNKCITSQRQKHKNKFLLV